MSPDSYFRDLKPKIQRVRQKPSNLAMLLGLFRTVFHFVLEFPRDINNREVHENSVHGFYRGTQIQFFPILLEEKGENKMPERSWSKCCAQGEGQGHLYCLWKLVPLKMVVMMILQSTTGTLQKDNLTYRIQCPNEQKVR